MEEELEKSKEEHQLKRAWNKASLRRHWSNHLMGEQAEGICRWRVFWEKQMMRTKAPRQEQEKGTCWTLRKPASVVGSEGGKEDSRSCVVFERHYKWLVDWVRQCFNGMIWGDLSQDLSLAGQTCSSWVETMKQGWKQRNCSADHCSTPGSGG